MHPKLSLEQLKVLGDNTRVFDPTGTYNVVHVCAEMLNNHLIEDIFAHLPPYVIVAEAFDIAQYTMTYLLKYTGGPHVACSY